MEKFGIGKSTIGDINRSKKKILAFLRKMIEMGSALSRKYKSMKLGDQKLDEAVFLWLKQKRMEGVPISGSMLREEAVDLSKRLYGESSNFVAIDGWKWRFSQRHGIQQLSNEGEKFSWDREQADTFMFDFREFICKEMFSMNQIFNCDETGLNYRLLPDRTLAKSFQNQLLKEKNKE
uniref:HTH CENPB-type domain-containing protein n=1 Tax=Amphimedon queenslandica TaxID=400682 RepID=A0A1X7VRE6_AMPQE